MDDWIVYSFLKHHPRLIRVMFDRYRQLQISLNLKKCNFVVPFGTLLGNIICKEGVCVDISKVTVIMNLTPPTYVWNFCSSLGHTDYYRRFIRNYASIIAPLEKLLNKFECFMRSSECEVAFGTLKDNLTNAPFLRTMTATNNSMSMLMHLESPWEL